jgi:hypothetical protein
MYAPVRKGGLGLIDVKNFLRAQKCSWLRRCTYKINDAWRWDFLELSNYRLNMVRLENFSKEQLLELLGRGRAKKGMFEGDLVNGELEIGQVSAIINEITTAESVVKELVDDCKKILIQTAAGFNFG